MQARRCRSLAILVGLGMAFVSAVSLAGDPSFETSVARVIRVNCLRCHNPRDAKGGLDLSTRAGLLRGGDTEPAIVVGEPHESLLIQRVAEGSMPPISDGDQLSAEQLELLQKWISAGAIWSGPALAVAASSPRVTNSTKGGPARRLRWLRARWLRRRQWP